MSVQCYLFFEGRADEAIAFYGKALDAEVLMGMTYADGPDGECPDGSKPPADKVMHASLRIGCTGERCQGQFLRSKWSLAPFSDREQRCAG